MKSGVRHSGTTSTHQRHGTSSRPVRELKGFHRITLAAGQTRTVTFGLGPSELRYWSAATRDWVQDATTLDIWVGGSSTADLSTVLEVSAADLNTEPSAEPVG
ncbi:MAG: fibronectin type III-like domain-contianing protein [Umezawaea sp.]